MRNIIIGDIHGCLSEFRLLTEKVNLDVNNDTLILLGDIIDKGPDSWNVYNYCRELDTVMGNRFILIKGSHEFLMLKDNKTPEEIALWDRIGKKTADLSFEKNGDKLLSDETISWFRKKCVPYYIGIGFQCAHGGIENEDISANDEYTLMRDHKIVKMNTYSGKLTITGHIHLTTTLYYDGSGGTAKELEYEKTYNLPDTGVICIDSGCVEGHLLTALVIENGSFHLKSVKSEREYWPAPVIK